MDTPRSIEPYIVFKAYAVVAALAGIILIAWGPMWLGSDLPGLPWYLAALIRILGAIQMAAACCAWQFSKMEDPVVCRRALLWFAIAHAIVAAVLMTQQHSVLTLPVAALALHYLEFIPAPEPSATLRSRYEQQIREAASQEERNRLARDLHDSIKQQIFVIQTSAATVQARSAIAELEVVLTHVGNVLAKLAVENRGQATVQALRRGLVSLEELG